MTNRSQVNNSQTDGLGASLIFLSTFTGVVGTFTDEILLQSSFSGQIGIFTDEIISTLTGVVGTFTDEVQDKYDFFESYGYDVQIIIDDFMTIDTTLDAYNYGLCDVMNIVKKEGVATQAVFSMIPPRGFQNVKLYQGKSVVITYRTAAGTFTKFTGYVDTPAVNILTGRITLTCSDRRNDRINQLDAGYIGAIGYYSNDVFGIPRQQVDHLNNRISTIPSSFDFDNNGNPTVTPWQPKVVPDFYLTNNPGDVFYTQPTVIYSARTQTVNTINLSFNYSFQRLHYQVASYNWPGYSNFCTDYWNVGQPDFPTRDAINSAAIVGGNTSGGWCAIGTVTFADLWPAQGFTCNSTVVWQPDNVQYTYQKATKNSYLIDPATGLYILNSDGTPQIVSVPILNADGTQKIEVASITTTNTSSQFCRGASWTACIHFAQTVTQQYAITVTASQSIDLYGQIPSSNSVTLTDPYDTSAWEAGKSQLISMDNFYIDRKPLFYSLIGGLICQYNKARTDILKAHRDVTVTFSKKLWAEIDIMHTVEIDVMSMIPNHTEGLHAKGKVSSIIDTINFGSSRSAVTTVELSLSQSSGSAVDNQFTIVYPTNDNPSYIGHIGGKTLGTHIGIDPDPKVTPNADKWDGFIGNTTLTTVTGVGTGTNIVKQRTNFPSSFIVNYPAIPDNLRNERVVTSESSFNVAIPNDLLEIYL